MWLRCIRRNRRSSSRKNCPRAIASAAWSPALLCSQAQPHAPALSWSPQRQLDALPRRAAAGSLCCLFVAELIRATQIVGVNVRKGLPNCVIQAAHLITADSGYVPYLVELGLHSIRLVLHPLLLLAKISAIGLMPYEPSPIRNRADEELLHHFQLCQR